MSTATDSAPADTGKMPRKDAWWRGAYMLFFVIATGIAQAIVNLMALVQFLSILVTGSPISQLSRFGVSLGTWASAMIAFQSGATEDKPFPWADWPGSPEH